MFVEPKLEGSREDQGSEEESEEAGAISDEGACDEEGEDIAPEGDGVRRIFRGKLEDALEIPVVKCTFDVLREVFCGHYITSNPAEALFHVKAALKAHRTVKSGNAFLLLSLFLWEKVRRWSRSEIRSFFRDEVATLERIMDAAVGRKGVFTSDPDPERVVMDAYRSEEPVVICYKDRKGRGTRGMIEPPGVETEPYTRMKKIEAYCYLREDRRTFFADRIVNAIPADTDLSIISPDSL